jgi:hypothetical protein
MQLIRHKIRGEILRDRKLRDGKLRDVIQYFGTNNLATGIDCKIARVIACKITKFMIAKMLIY